MAKIASTKLTKLWGDQNIKKTVKVMLPNSLTFPNTVYSSEKWTLKSWLEHRTNAPVLQELQIKKRLNQMGEKENLLGKVEGKIPRGRSPMRWTHRLKEMAGHSMHEAIHLAQHRNAWKQHILKHA